MVITAQPSILFILVTYGCEGSVYILDLDIHSAPVGPHCQTVTPVGCELRINLFKNANHLDEPQKTLVWDQWQGERELSVNWAFSELLVSTEDRDAVLQSPQAPPTIIFIQNQYDCKQTPHSVMQTEVLQCLIRLNRTLIRALWSSSSRTYKKDAFVGGA